MFDRVAGRYDLLNDVLSLGLDRWWRRQAVRAVRCGPGDLVLDLGCGTGKLGGMMAARCRVVGVDLSWEMLRLARRRDPFGTTFVQGSAFRLPFRPGSFDACVSGFMLRNLEDLPGALAELARVLRPGGCVVLLDITEPRGRLFRAAFHAWFGVAAPALGAMVGRARAYRYLVGSLGQLPPPEGVISLLRAAGFDRPTSRPLTRGIVTLFTATRSAVLAASPRLPDNRSGPTSEGGTR
jgi:demethylmenaquinone methyltransferase / 2-methoxy-6-polyprenyl-1,4-benzoquinol methylase